MIKPHSDISTLTTTNEPATHHQASRGRASRWRSRWRTLSYHLTRLTSVQMTDPLSRTPTVLRPVPAAAAEFVDKLREHSRQFDAAPLNRGSWTDML